MKIFSTREEATAVHAALSSWITEHETKSPRWLVMMSTFADLPVVAGGRGLLNLFVTQHFRQDPQTGCATHPGVIYIRRHYVGGLTSSPCGGSRRIIHRRRPGVRNNDRCFRRGNAGFHPAMSTMPGCASYSLTTILVRGYAGCPSFPSHRGEIRQNSCTLALHAPGAHAHEVLFVFARSLRRQ